MIESGDGGDGLQDGVAVADGSVRHLENADRRRREERHLLGVFTGTRSSDASDASDASYFRS